MNCGERINELLFDNKINAKQLAQDLSVSLTTLNRWRRNETQFLLSNLISLADYFQVTTDFLLCKTEDTPKVIPKVLPKFSTRLRQVMKEKRITTYTLRQISKYDGKYFQQWDKGSEPNVATLLDLSKILDCTVEYLIGRE